MNLDPSWAVQTTVYAALTAAGLSVCDFVEQNPTFPFVLIGEDHVLLGDNDYQYSGSCDIHVIVHAFSRQKGRQELKQIGSTIRATLEAGLVFPGFMTLGYEFVDYLPRVDPDDLTQHLTYEVKYTVLATNA